MIRYMEVRDRYVILNLSYFHSFKVHIFISMCGRDEIKSLKYRCVFLDGSY